MSGVAWYTVVRRLMGRPEQLGGDRAPITGRELGIGPRVLERRPSSVEVVITAILSVGLIALTTYLWITHLVLIPILVGLIGLALAGAAVSGWRQHRARRGQGS
jgi:hypothetical protein